MYIAALECPYPSKIANAQMVIHGLRPGNTVSYVCDIGHKFEHGGTVRSIICGTNFKWSTAVQDCKGEIYFNSCNFTNICFCLNE